MYLIVGLGNPEQEYNMTRHNMGFHAINKLANQYQIEMNKKKFTGIYGKGIIEGEKAILLKPQTYMNLSGNCVFPFYQYYQIEKDHLILIYDDIDIAPGVVKIRKKGGAGTHNGMKSVVQKMGTGEFPRVRVGIGNPEKKENIISYVIGAIPEEEKEVLEEASTIAKQAVISILKNGIDTAMNEINQKER